MTPLVGNKWKALLTTFYSQEDLSYKAKGPSVYNSTTLDLKRALPWPPDL